ncbi:MAG: hypothetical protein KC656_20990, partial [Myxococcales bacterium]|nr:hypothetical protein [Myxococcales bacterium]
MLALLVTSALGSTCSIVLSTREAYRPTSGDIDLGESGGWRRETFSGLTPARRAQMELYKKEFKRLPAAIQDEIVKGELPDGLDEVAAVLAWGEPGYVWPSDRRCIGMLYGVDEGLPVALEACDGRIVERVQLLRTVPCTRLAQGVDRWDKKAKHFAEYTFLQQLDILAGHKGDWMDDKAFELAFG